MILAHGLLSIDHRCDAWRWSNYEVTLPTDLCLVDEQSGFRDSNDDLRSSPTLISWTGGSTTWLRCPEDDDLCFSSTDFSDRWNAAPAVPSERNLRILIIRHAAEKHSWRPNWDGDRHLRANVQTHRWETDRNGRRNARSSKAPREISHIARIYVVRWGRAMCVRSVYDVCDIMNNAKHVQTCLLDVRLTKF